MANPKTFPTLVPSARSYSPGTYPSTTFESLDGTKTHIRFGNKRVNATLSLSFSNITDAEAASILDNYEEVNSTWDYVAFTLQSLEGALAGVDRIGPQPNRYSSGYELTKYMREENNKTVRPSGLKWRYSGPPTVQSVYPGISNVSCSFVACLDAPI